MMTQQVDRSARASGFPLWRAIGFVVGLVLLAMGVALHENGVDAGRLLILSGLPLAAGALILLALPGRAPRAIDESPEARMAALLAHVAAHARLEVEGDRVVGRFKDREVEGTIAPPDGPVEARALVQRHLDLGLTVRRGRPSGDARPRAPVGEGDFDNAYCVLVDEPERARQLLTTRMRELLLSMDAELDDAGVHLRLPGCDGKGLLEALRLGVKLAYELERASTRVRCADALAEAREAWLAFAQEHRLATVDTPLAMWGKMDDLAVRAISLRDSFQHYHFELTVDFPAPLGRGLELKPASAAKQFDRTGEPVGHPAFDKVFVINATNPQDAPRLVGPEARAALLELRDAGLQLRAHDGGLWAWVALSRAEPGRVPQAMVRMSQIAARIVANSARFPARHG